MEGTTPINPATGLVELARTEQRKGERYETIESAAVIAAAWLATPAGVDPSSGGHDGLLGALSQPAGTPFTGDLQAWIRNADLKPDWLRIGTDIIGGAPVQTFNMMLSLTGETVPQAGTPGRANSHGKSVSALAHQFGGVDAATTALGFSSVETLQDAVETFCE